MYTYKDFVTGRIKRTRGKFYGWSERTGPLHVRYAMFQNPRGWVNVPAYLLTAETKAAIPPMPRGQEQEEQDAQTG